MPVYASISEARAALAGHGGRLAAAEAAFPEAPRPWLDLSTGLNPRPYPAPHASLPERARLPDPERLAALEAVAAAAFGCAPEQVLATAGAEAGIRLLAATLQPGSVAVAGPTYGGHAAAWRAAGTPVALVARAEAARATADALVLVNPNNPDGAASPAEAVAALAAAREGWLIVDEAFVEAEPGLSVAGFELERTVVLRSFGKFYGLAGLRLGFVVADPALIARLRARQGEWPVCAEAIAAGLRAYPDTAWAERTRRRLARDAARLDGLLMAAGFEIVGGTALFRLARVADARDRFERLARRGVLVRPFEDAPDRLRFGLPAATGWKRLEAALLERER